MQDKAGFRERGRKWGGRLFHRKPDRKALPQRTNKKTPPPSPVQQHSNKQQQQQQQQQHKEQYQQQITATANATVCATEERTGGQRPSGMPSPALALGLMERTWRGDLQGRWAPQNPRRQHSAARRCTCIRIQPSQRKGLAQQTNVSTHTVTD